MQEARQQIIQTGAFPVWLSARHVTLDSCTQTDLDAWHVEKHATRRPAQTFLRWCMDTRRLPWLTIPNRPTTNPDPTGQHQHIAALQRVLADDSTSPRVRVAACLVLLFAQPVSRIVRMTTDNVVHDGQHVTLRLGAPLPQSPSRWPTSCSTTSGPCPPAPLPSTGTRIGSFPATARASR
ncbi:hypothetical protein [Streptomyces murinus]|uniref:hypothetical protein n=1 Tax=Streptomyces murinus TaxID=33900 RepID=UPI0018F5B1FD|nr:hypothetical protein [Streptomyces murinus]